MIQAVLFDAGATLLHPDPPVEEIYAREFAADGVAFSPEEFARALTEAWEQVRAGAPGDRYGGVRGESAFWHLFLNRVRGALDGGRVSEETLRRLASHFRRSTSWVIFEDVVETLEALEQRGLRLAVVSNWDSHLPDLLGQLGLQDRFATISVSAIEETGKPEPEIFRRTCARLAIRPDEALHVGDSMAEDYEGARAAGLEALLLDRQARYPGRANRIESLREIPSWLSGKS